MRRLVALALLSLVTATTIQAQGFAYSVRSQTYQGEIKEVRGNTIIWESDGKTGPIPYDRATTLTVSGTGDAGFVTPGAVVTISGTLRPDKSIIGASMSVHANPKETGQAVRVTVSEADPQIRVKGQIVSFEPLTIKAIDGISMTQASQQNQRAGAMAPPAYGVVLQVKLRDPKPETVGLILGSAPRLIAAGDTATVTVREDRPKVASAISIRKTEPLKSGRKKPEEKKEEGDAAKKPAEEGTKSAEEEGSKAAEE